MLSSRRFSFLSSSCSALRYTLTNTSGYGSLSRLSDECNKQSIYCSERKMAATRFMTWDKPCFRAFCTVAAPLLVQACDPSRVALELEHAIDEQRYEDAWIAYEKHVHMVGLPRKSVLSKLIVGFTESCSVHWLNKAYSVVEVAFAESKHDLLEKDVLIYLAFILSRSQLSVLTANIVRKLVKMEAFPPVTAWSGIIGHMSQTSTGALLASELIMEIGYLFKDNRVDPRKKINRPLLAMKPNAIAFKIVLTGCLLFGTTRKAEELLELMPRIGVKPNSNLLIVMAQIYEKNGHRDELIKLKRHVDEAIDLNIVDFQQFYDCLFSCHLKFKDLDAAVDMVLDMLRKAKEAKQSLTAARSLLQTVEAGSSIRCENKNKGVQPLLDAVVDYLPSPLELPPIKGTDADNPEVTIERLPKDDEPFAGLAFKIMNDSFVGSLTFVRVYSGKLAAGSYVLNANKGKRERIGRLLEMHANSREDVKAALTGDIVALAGLKDTITGETLCDPDNPVVLERMDFPDPVIKVAIEPKTKADVDKMANGLIKLVQEDPSFHFSRDEETNQTVIEGMGELHLDIIVDRLKREFKVEANVGAPQVNYRESISRISEVQYIHKKQSGGAGQFADITVRFEPLEPGSGYEFKSEIKGGAVPKEYIPGVMKGLEECMSNGVLAGYPVVDVRAVLVDGSYHDVDSSVLAFQLAARGAFRQGIRKANPRLLEPIMKVEVVTPEEHLGDVIGDLNSRRGQINNFGDKPGGLKVVDALVPLAEMFQYVSTLRGMTKGRASYTMQLANFDVVPQHIQNQLAAKEEAATA